MWRALHAAIFGASSPAAPKPAAAAATPDVVAVPHRVRADGVISTPAGNRPVVYLPGTGRGYFLAVTGESVYQDVLTDQWLKMRPDRETSVRLTAEPSNAHDPHAVAVQTFAGETVGYLPREEAARYQQLLVQIEALGLIGVCTAKMLGGTSRKKHLGVFLDIEPPTVVASKLGLTYTRVVAVAVSGAGSPPEQSAAPRRTWVQRPPPFAVRTSSLPIGDASHHDLGSGAGYSLGVVGESHRQAALHALAGSRLQRGEQVTFTATLIPEPTNPVDVHAIIVSIQGGAPVGYLQRDDALRYRPVFEALAVRRLIGVARAKLIGGVAGKPSIGVLLDMSEPQDLLGAIEPQPF
jgi:hypothetical protein